ncbi:uncharacterized protein BYT42DRAFT_555585 [Radiomyces spectabilis]|uniref:uncharacterized protein n=1 Tax=Radiomyces spectabilis TaxID=64574 RepID=UPI00221E4DC1|nr:uncharacterized protein BYT42DRAFT_555585 [Radiomyces spectabilis]KAI8391097.1 hypothetical protein BYT42DRAFT_555585 [Radiomyces spectabilis]
MLHNMTSTSRPKSLKWAMPRDTPKKSGRVQKRKSAPGGTLPSKYTKDKKQKTPATEIERLENELSFTYDTLATIMVHYESVCNAYSAGKPQLEKSSHPNQLCDMEKELLAAYDDLHLQITHLERKVVKLENKIKELRSVPAPTPQASPYSVTESISSPSTVSSVYDSPFFVDECLYSMQPMQPMMMPMEFLPQTMLDPALYMSSCAVASNCAEMPMYYSWPSYAPSFYPAPEPADFCDSYPFETLIYDHPSLIP